MTTLVLGLGNAYRRDDSVGLAIVERLRARLPAPVEVVRSSGEATDLMSRWEGRDAVYVVDAARSDATAGTLHRIEAHREPLPSALFQGSSHAFGLVQAVELSRVLGDLPVRLVIYAVEGADFATGTGMSPAVAAAADQVVERLLVELSAETNPCTNFPC